MTLAALVFVTSNPHKAREAARFLGRPVEARRLEIPELQSLEFAEVVRAKALAAARVLGCPVLVEDSGLSLAAWNGYPGPLTKWVTRSVGEAGLARMLDPFADRSAEAVSSLAVARPGEPDPLVAIGRAPGSIATAPRGTNGFGWDVIFVPAGGARTFAEMSAAEKDAISHRARAFAALRELLR